MDGEIPKMYPENLPAKYTQGLKPEEVPTMDARTRRKVEKYLRAFRDDATLSQTRACVVAKISPNTLARWQQYPEFQMMLNEINEIRRIRIEDALVEQALQPKGTLDRMFILKKLDPSYKERQDQQPTHITLNIDPGAVREALRRQASIEAEIAKESLPEIVDAQ